MSWDFDPHNAAAVLASATGHWWERLSDEWKALLVIAAVAVVAWSGRGLFEDMIGRGARLSDLEEWQETHMATATTPGLEAISNLQYQDSIRAEQIDTMFVFLQRIYCDYYPEDCPPRLRRGAWRRFP